MIHKPFDGFTEVFDRLRRVAADSSSTVSDNPLQFRGRCPQNLILVGAQKLRFNEGRVRVAVDMVTDADSCTVFFRIDFGGHFDFRISDFVFERNSASLRFLQIGQIHFDTSGNRQKRGTVDHEAQTLDHRLGLLEFCDHVLKIRTAQADARFEILVAAVQCSAVKCNVEEVFLHCFPGCFCRVVR